MHPSYDPKKPYVGLLVIRGYSQSPTKGEVDVNPSARFQKEYIERWASEHDIEIKAWKVISSEHSRRIDAGSASLRDAIGATRVRNCRSVMDDASRLLEFTHRDGVFELRRFLKGQGLFLHSNLQDAPVFQYPNAKFSEFIKPKLHAFEEAERVRAIEKEIDRVGKVPRMRYSRSAKERAEQGAPDGEDRFMLCNISAAHQRICSDQPDKILTVRELLDDLKARGVPTARGMEWSEANLRKFLKQFADRHPNDPVLNKIKFRRGGD